MSEEPADQELPRESYEPIERHQAPLEPGGESDWAHLMRDVGTLFPMLKDLRFTHRWGGRVAIHRAGKRAESRDRAANCAGVSGGGSAGAKAGDGLIEA